MAFFTNSRPPQDTVEATTEEGPAPEGPPEHIPDDATTDGNTDTGSGTEGMATVPAHATRSGTTGDASDGAGGGLRARYPAAARTVTWVTTALAAALVLSALVLPDQLSRLTPGAFARIPVEGILGAAVLLVLPLKARRVAAVLAGVVLGVLTILDFLDMGFYSVLDRPFDPVLDWGLFADAESFLRDSVGRAGAIGAVVLVLLLVVALPLLMAWAVVRLSRLTDRHAGATVQGTLALGTVWIICMALGVPVASRSTAESVGNRVEQVNADLNDNRAFAKEAAVDPFRNTPADQLLTGLRGKDVIFTFIESYGRSAVQDPAIAPGVDAVLADGTSRLRAAGFSSRSAFLTSPTAGGGSWLAHSTLLSGLWITNQQRYRSVTSSDRLTLTGAFRRAAAWRTVGIMPGVTRAWPEARFFGLDNVYDSRNLGYKGPKFSWSPVPDQYSLSSFERLEHGKPGPKPLMSEIILTSSHTPWAPIPEMVGWDQVGNGSEYNAIKKAGENPKDVWKDPAQVRTQYGRSIQYSLNSLISYVEKYGKDNTVLVFLGDHQPAPIVTGENASRDVPITIVAHDPAVLDRISSWGWQDGLKPGPDAPVWRMDTFRNRFLTAYGPQPGASPSPSSR
ncbi:sulfatase [Peterkaempfera sp. SMS 1(5)a]|uniref:sulfatase n=1 Tax=Peterkaempfera podocarpi TaxID=3232308 RepID=UPI00366F08B7